MSKLFALEEMEKMPEEMGMTVSPEEGEVADAQMEMQEQSEEIEEQVEAVEEGMAASDQLEEVEELVEQAVENGEGLDPVAAEAVRIAVEAICSRIGADPKSVYSLYATENFQSPSSRKANSKIALEGVSEFLVDLWERIKAAMKNLWDKLKKYWNQYATELGRIKSALESMKSKISKSSGKVKREGFVEKAPSSLVRSIGFRGNISTKEISDILTTHKQYRDGIYNLVGAVGKVAVRSEQALEATTDVEIKSVIDETSKSKMIEAEYLVGGLNIKHEVNVDSDEYTVEVVTTKETVELSSEEVSINIEDKDALKSMINGVLAHIKEIYKAREQSQKLEEAFSKFSVKANKVIKNTTKNDGTGTDNTKYMRKLLSIVYKLNSKVALLSNESTHLDVKLAKAAISYASLNLKYYK